MTETTKRPTRRDFLRAGFGTLLAFSTTLRCRWVVSADAQRGLRIADHLSPRNAHRPLRPHTLYIVLHTTEGADSGSLDKVWRQGETHYFVKSDGGVLRIIDRDKIATHAGRSIWEGHRNIDDYSIGIEVVGYHDRDITDAQTSALRELLRQLKGTYGITDKRVLTHSMVAYGNPNRFFRRDHRGRKRCGMIFARPDVRSRLGLDPGPEHDADVEAGRLIVGDAELYSFLFGHKSVAAAGAGAHAPALNIRTNQTPPESIRSPETGRPGTSLVNGTTAPRLSTLFPTANSCAATRSRIGTRSLKARGFR
jgi:N-acetylmuramoyl-L-alanine amidase